MTCGEKSKKKKVKRNTKEKIVETYMDIWY